MSLKALQDYTYYSKYARFNHTAGRRETWSEAVDRVKDMHLSRFPQISDEINWAFEQVRRKRVLGSQRALQFGGTPILRKHARLYNCTVSFCDRLRFFQEAFWLLLCGCGAGFSVQKHHIAKLPQFSDLITVNLNSTEVVWNLEKTFVVPDTIEGWADALGVLLESYFKSPEITKGTEWEGTRVKFDFSLIRKKGSPLSSGSGKAPGPEPLRRSLEVIRKLLDRCVLNGQDRLRPIDAYDIIMHASDAVLSGGVRRSATICLFSPDDMEMVTAKTGNWFTENPQRGRSNNSALLLRNQTPKEDFLKLIASVKEFGEPGFVWSDSTELVVNPCVVGDTLVATDAGLQSVTNLVYEPFAALVDGKPYRSEGFWKTGHKSVVNLTFASGRELRVTPNHQIMTTNGWKEAGSLTSEDEVVIHNHRDFAHKVDSSSADYAQGYCLGNFLSDGNVGKETAEMKWWGEGKEEYREDCLHLTQQAGWRSLRHIDWPNTKADYSVLSSVKLLDFAEQKGCLTNGKSLTKQACVGSWSYLSGLVAGYFDGDGTVSFNPEKGSSLRIWSTSVSNLQQLQIILNAFGIWSSIYKDRMSGGPRMLPDGQGGLKEYHCQDAHELCISCDNIERFLEIIPIRNKAKLKLAEQIVASRRRLPNRTHFIDRLVKMSQGEEEDVYDCTVEDIHAFDADGVYVHNCVEIGMCPMNEAGVSGWQMCNLCEINGKKIKTKEDWKIAARAAAIIGTCQAAYTDFDYLGNVTKEIVEKEALLGVSITGMMDSPEILFDPELQQEMAKFILDINEKLAPRIGINPCARATCIKPAGTTSCLLGTGSGVHPHHARRYFRRTQANMMEAPLQFFKKHNPHAVRKSVWSANGTDEVITFCVQVPPGAKVKNDLDALTMLQHVKLTQANWVTAGCVKERCTQPWLMHNVSNTINIRPDEWDAVIDYIYENREFFAGISLLPISGDKDFPQAPMCQVFTPKEIVGMYGDGSLLASGLIVDGLKAFGDNLWEACEAVLGLGREIKEPVQPQGQNFTEHAVYRRDVDYTDMFEATDETRPMDTIACAGGCCTI
jgi:hypothetical protein